jgi:F-type H+-transporting ATPase subunit gamma
MASLKDVKRKIDGVKKTKQITKAMNMVASAKLRGAQGRIERFRPYADKFYAMLQELSSGAGAEVHPLLEVREQVTSVGIIVVTSDRGLCGSFNVNLIREARRLVAAKIAEGKSVKLYCVGKKGHDFFRKLEYEILVAHRNVMNSFDFSLANELGLQVIGDFLAGTVDEVHLVHGQFISIARQLPRTVSVLPLTGAEAVAAEDVKPAAAIEYIYEPDREGLLAELLPRFVKVQIYRGMLDTSASEHAARMVAMDNATSACDDMIGSLTLIYNKTRQSVITKELMDIVGGAEALKG